MRQMIYSTLAAVLFFPAILWANPAEDEIAARDTIAQINHINWVVSKIKTYNNILVLEEEYRQISPDKLNLNRIPDEDALKRITDMLDLLHEMIAKNKELEHWKKIYEIKKKQRHLSFYREILLPTVNDASTTFATPIMSAVDPLAAGMNMVLSTTKSTLQAYSSYKDLVTELEMDALNKKFELAQDKFNKLHDLNKALLTSQWNMIQKYNFDDSLRVSDSDISILIEALKDTDFFRIYSRIEAMKDRFKIFPMYWYYLSCAAMEAGQETEALNACNTFFEVNRGLFRDDPTVGSIAMNKAFLLPKTEENKPEIRRLLELVWKHNAGDVDWRKDYFCATLYYSYLNDKPNALKALNHAIAYLEYACIEQLQRVSELQNSDELNLQAAVDFSDGESLWLCQKLKDEIQKDTLVYDENGLTELCRKRTTSTIEKLAYVGKMRASDLWGNLKEDLGDVTLSADRQISWKGKFNYTCRATVPFRWFLSGDLTVNLELVCGENKTVTISENLAKRSLTDAGKLVLTFDIPEADFKAVEIVKLAFLHPDYPVTLTYASATVLNSQNKAAPPDLIMIDDEFSPQNRLNDLHLMEAQLLGKKYHYSFKKKTFVPESDGKDWESEIRKKFSDLRDWEPGEIILQKGCVEKVAVNESGQVKIYYKNTADSKKAPAISVYLLNQYGVIVARIDEKWRFKRLSPGEEAETDWLDGSKNPAYIAIEVEE